MKKVFVVIVIIILGIIFYKLAFIKPAHAPSQSSDINTQLANPASVNCAKKGGKLVIQTRGDGGQYGVCYFEDNMACEEWALFRGECPVGGVKTTGFDNIQQQYCAWLGGKTLAVENATCTLPNGKVCGVNELYDGTCQN